MLIPALPGEAGLATGDARSPKEGGAISSKVFVGNLNFDTTREELETLFTEIGQVVDVVLPTDRMSGRPRGFAFVELSTPEAATQAIEKFDGFELGGRRLRVNEATGERTSRPGGAGGAGGGGFSRPAFGQDRPGGGRPFRPKGSRRNIRGRKRSIS
jgi:cold-inducible RNA-binding protein